MGAKDPSIDAVVISNVAEDAYLEKLGYKQGEPNNYKQSHLLNPFDKTELKRSFSLLGMVGFSFSIITRYVIHGLILFIFIDFILQLDCFRRRAYHRSQCWWASCDDILMDWYILTQYLRRLLAGGDVLGSSFGWRTVFMGRRVSPSKGELHRS